MYIDDDEWFGDSSVIIDFFNTGEYQKYNTAYYIPRNYTTVDGKDFENFWALRMSRLTRDIHFAGKGRKTRGPVTANGEQV